MHLTNELWRLKNRIIQNLDPEERAFRKVYKKISKVEGFLISPHQEKWFFKTAIRAPENAVIVEIGSFKGRSTVSFAFGCVGTSKHVYAIDLFEGDHLYYGSG